MFEAGVVKYINDSLVKLEKSICILEYEVGLFMPYFFLLCTTFKSFRKKVVKREVKDIQKNCNDYWACMGRIPGPLNVLHHLGKCENAPEELRFQRCSCILSPQGGDRLPFEFL